MVLDAALSFIDIDQHDHLWVSESLHIYFLDLSIKKEANTFLSHQIFPPYVSSDLFCSFGRTGLDYPVVSASKAWQLVSRKIL